MVIERPSLEPLDPDPDQSARDVVTLGDRMKRFARNEFLGNPSLKLEAMRAVSGHGFHPLKARLSPVNFAVLWFTTNSNLLDCSTGSSPGLLTAENAADINSGEAAGLRNVAAGTHEPAGQGKNRVWTERRYIVPNCQRSKSSGGAGKDGVSTEQDAADL
jgi:hypothetical protein